MLQRARLEACAGGCPLYRWYSQPKGELSNPIKTSADYLSASTQSFQPSIQEDFAYQGAAAWR